MKGLARRLGGAALAVVGALALLVGSAMTLLRTDWGADTVKRLALPRVNERLAGRLEVGRFRFGGDHLSVTDIVLRDPEGEVVARVNAVQVRFSPLALLRSQVRMSQVTIDDPALMLRQGPSGLNLTRAVASRAPASARGPGRDASGSSSRGLVLDLADLRIRGGSLLYRSDGDHARPDADVSGLSVNGRGRYETGTAAFSLDARLGAQANAPVAAPLALRITGHGQGDSRHVELEAEAGASALAATIATTGPTDASLRVRRLHVTPDLVSQLAPDLRLLEPVTTAVALERAGSRITFDVDAESRAGALRASGILDVGSLRARQVVLRGRDIDLGRLLGGLPRSDFSFTLHGEGSGPDLRTASGKADLSLPEGRLGGALVGPVDVRLEAVEGRYTLRELRAVFPGVTLSGIGIAGPHHVALSLAVRADDLHRLTRTLASFPGLSLPPLTGSGRIDVAVSGTARAPGVSVSAQFPALAVGENRVVGLTSNANVANLHAPEIASLDLKLRQARFAGHVLRGGVVRVRSTAGGLVADVGLRGATPLALHAGGTWGPGHRSFELHQLAVGYPEAHWTLSDRARLSWGPERLAIAGLRLQAGAQRVRLSFDKNRTRLRARVGLVAIDLARLPRIAVPPTLAVGGRLDVTGEIDGMVGRPEVRATVSLREGRLGRYHDLTLDLDGRERAGRAVGHLRARGLASAVDAAFDVPLAWPLADGRTPIDLDVSLVPTDLTQVWAAIGAPTRPRVSGRIGVDLHLHGSVASPTLALDATAHGLVAHEQTVGDVALHVSAAPGQPLQAAAKIEASGRGHLLSGGASQAGRAPLSSSADLQLRTDLPLGSLRTGLPSTARLMQTRFDLAANLKGLPLATLARLARSAEVGGGVASLRLSASGTVRSPRGALNIQVTGATGPRFPTTDARLDASLDEREGRLAVRALRQGRVLLSASAIVGASSRRLDDLAALARAPLTVTAAFGPVHLHHEGMASTSVGGVRQNALSGEARATLTIDGSLDRPAAKLTADIDDLRLADRPMGAAHALVTYSGRRAEADLRLASGPGGELHLTASTAADLGYSQVRRGLDVNLLPIEAALDARRLDLSVLSGLTDDVRHVAGDLSAAVTAGGTLGDPTVRGQLEWTNGTLSLTTLGDYTNVHLMAHGDRSGLSLDQLDLTSGEGRGHVTASASRRNAHELDLKTTLALSRFPIYAQGRALALISVDGSATGTASRQELRASAHVSEAHVELTDAKRKDLQALGRPADVILMDGGRPVDKQEAAKLAQLTRRLDPLAASLPASGPPPPPSHGSTLRTSVSLVAPRNLWIQGNDASIEVGVAPGFRMVVDGGVTSIYGQTLLRRGRIDVLGRRFDLQAGSLVQFVGPPESPRIDVTAKHVNETENITVVLTAKGTLDKMAISVSSPERPDLTEGQLYALIVTGRLQMGGNTAGSTSASGEAASLVGGVVAARLQKALAKRLPLDVLTLQAGEGLSGSRLEAGTYLTRKLYAGYVGRTGANPALLQNRNAVHLEYQLSRRWSFDGEYGDVGTGTADLLWTKHY